MPSAKVYMPCILQTKMGHSAVVGYNNKYQTTIITFLQTKTNKKI